jgi:hypothetical protein
MYLFGCIFNFSGFQMRAFFEQFGDWRFDPVSSFLTMILVPTGIYAVYIIRKFIKDVAAYIIDGIVYVLNKIVIHRVAATLTLKRYCRLQLAGVTKSLRIPASAEISINIDDVFIPLVLENTGLGVSYNSSSLLSAGNRLRIIGDPGSGKSSAAKRLFRDECQRAISGVSKCRFPIFIELRNLELPKSIASNKLGEWLFGYIKQVSAKHEVYNLEKCFDIYSHTSGLLVIFDGLDEVSSASYPRLAIALVAFSEKLGQLGENNAIVITLRTQFHQQIRADFDNIYPTVLSVKRFSPSDIYEFLTRWPFAAHRFENVVRIYNDLTDRPSLREMCTNPLVLSMYVAQDQIGGNQIAPDSRTEFYSKVAEELLIKRRAKQIGALNAQAVVREQRLRILGKLAFDHLCDPDQAPNHLVWDHAVKVVSDIIKCRKRDDAIGYLRDLAKETGLIGEEQENESFRFIHLTFCEFFCAYEAVNGQVNGWETLLDRHRRFQDNPALRSRLVEALPFATALLPRHTKSKALDQIGACDDTHLLAMTFLETKNYVHPLWSEFVDTTITDLSASSSAEAWDARWLRELHLFLVVASDAERASEVTPGIERSDAVAIFFEQFSKRAGATLSRLIANYADQDAAAAFRVATLCEIDLLNDIPDVVVASCSQPPFIAVALERALRDAPALSPVWASLFAEGGLASGAGAEALSRRSDRPWQQLIEREVSASRRWSNPGLGSESFYTDCITLGYHAGLNHRATPLLNILASIPAPSSFSRLSNLCLRFWMVPFFLSYMSIGILIGWSTNVKRTFENVGFSVFLTVFCFGFIFVVIAVFAYMRLELYGQLINRSVQLSSPAKVFRNLGRILRSPFTGFASADLSVSPFEGGTRSAVRWAGFATPGPLRSKKLIDRCRELFLKRAGL